MTFDDLVRTKYDTIGRIGSIETYDDGDIFITVYFDDGATERFNSLDLELVNHDFDPIDPMENVIV